MTAGMVRPPVRPMQPQAPCLPRAAELAGWIAESLPDRPAVRPAKRQRGGFRVRSGSRASPTYRLHAYWSKKPHEILRPCLETFTRPGGVGVDPFAGGGVHVVRVAGAAVGRANPCRVRAHGRVGLRGNGPSLFDKVPPMRRAGH